MFRLFISFVCLLTLSACEPVPEQPTVHAKQVETEKPVPFTRIRVIEKTLRELRRIERPLKAYFSKPTVDALPACATTKHPAGYISVTTWACGIDPTERGRREIVGQEMVQYSKDKSSLIYTAQLTITNFDDLEERADAHTLEIQRKFVLAFENSSSSSNIDARISGYIREALKPSVKWRGSNFQIKIKGLLRGDALNPTFKTGSSLTLSGEVWGENDLRDTKLGSGQFIHVANSDIEMKNSGVDECVRPVGSWKLSASGGGSTSRHDATSSLSSVDEDGGLSMSWDTALCHSP